MNIARTARLSFRLMDENDAELLYELDNDPEVMKHLTRGKVSTMQGIKEVFIPRLNAYRNEQKGWGLWQVNIIESNEFIGWVLVRPMGFFEQPDFSDLEIGWRFKKMSWGKGYASEAALAIAKAVSEPEEVKSLSATALKDNLGSIKVMEKLGLKFVKNYNHKDEQGELPAVLYSCPKEQLS
ncbi:GNAT family N-acetyltransferase [Pseudoalteromonas shioyasakiensis]|uniref:GNAT family N-acetyltransferase n=1 Tax=Pseudoalteromonas shioyasakiensis TaxID=1190813 RepID=A0ABT6TUP0_9GAMM|nr:MULTISPECIES: GNAT family N-acetyltransferase [Pseudoalteromonas]MDI4667606.1 GNAT family N-acetyltransferase [Pseudoalteromonas shioyasakiensis]MDI4673163.1 GNAT family N-acetyltransferase [Pseudoalteromonas shioyasakiensis]MDI4685228.1 GNAT family N-acetyltransferase [Pseudoalteromonas shioyasakiensis]MDI4705045.1 GNAT family N-acetyltransferase [Pseudoalteromonas shioyasakiensis]NUJ20564.1 GNAT family N-acetyltransferase [Pseudoalteromonas sp. 0802]